MSENRARKESAGEAAITTRSGDGMVGGDGDDELERLVRRLDADSTDDAMDAQGALTHRGRDTDVITPLLRCLPTLTRYGQLCAIEIIEELGDARAAPSLIELLTSEHDTVREWAALALSDFPVPEAVPALWRAYHACRSRGVDPDWSEPVGYRFALTALGARRPVVPPLTASLRLTTAEGVQAWPSTRLPEVLDDLASHGQVTLYFQLWRVESDTRYWTSVPDNEPALDFALPWPSLIGKSLRRAAAIAVGATLKDDVVATIKWIDEADR
ncbi:HEAT repeat domain-containing protein [Amycolatopsis sp. NPDC051758]|uniref:HEAT repeat domain-containing protein n=1 Tax=Amycolatopsis sp. NPDC051758 TaxID=3363935 RepID=UPI0037AE502A